LRRPLEALCRIGDAPAHQKGYAVSTTQVPLFTLFALNASLDFEAPTSNNVKGGTMHAEAGSAMWT
jgi:hypothetical protein